MKTYIYRLNRHKKIFVFCSLFFLSAVAWADHIVGGNIEMIALDKTPGRYKVIVKVYYDRLKVSSTTYYMPITIYRKSDKKTMFINIAARIDSKRQLLKFTNATCAQQNKLEIVLDVFELEINLNPNDYTDPGGYALVLNECCRSQEITNITFPDRRGIPFYTEFSPLIKNSKPFVDSTPEFDEIDGEYVCLGDDFTYSFDATDRDGDELRYSLVTPLSFYDAGYAASAPGNIQTEYIEWKAGYSATNAIPGNPSLGIDAKYGELSVRASEVGLFTFTVLVEEYRKGEKIGATRRDYQLFVFDCPPLIPPDPTITINDMVATEASACQGASILLKATANAAWNYQWKKDGDNIPNANSPTLAVTEGGIYQLVTYLKDQCSKTRRSRKVKIDFTTSRYQLTTSGPPKICSNNGKLTISSPQNANYSYQWYRDGQLLGITGFAITATLGGNYWAVLRDTQQGCSSRSDTVAVATASAASASIGSSQGNQLCVGSSAVLSVNGDAIRSYQWTKDGQNIANETKNSLSVAQAGSYAVVGIDTNGCLVQPPPINIAIVAKVTVTLDSIPHLCGANLASIALKGTPTGGTYTGAGVVGSLFDPKAAGVGTHLLTYTIKGDLDCQNGEAKRSVVIAAPPVLNLGNDREIYKGSSTDLNGDLGAGYVYSWSPPTSLSNPRAGRTNAYPDKTTTYTLKASGPNGCTATDTITIRVVTTIYIPDVFSPNADGTNDVWLLRGLDNYPEVEVRVFNRWGQAVFYAKGANQNPFDGNFNGTALPMGVYSYLIDTGTQQIFRGVLRIVR